jgi:RNA polymerase sigma factor (TIGR02999 family)
LGEPGDITRLLLEMRGGDNRSAAQLFALVYAQLRRIAAGMMQNERLGHTLQPTAVVHEAYMRLVGDNRPSPENRAQFFALAARAMRQVLVDHARHKLAQRRGGEKRVREEFQEVMALTVQQSEEVLAIHEALERLQQLDVQQGQVMEMHYFAGNSVAEIATVLEIGERTVKRELRMGRLFLKQQLENRGMIFP